MSNNLQTIDFNNLDSIINGDENFKKELIGIFLEQIPVFINNMNQFFIENKLEKLSREAHTAKSSVLIFGMINTGLLLKEIQFLAENNKVEEIEPALKQVKMDLNHAKTELQNALKEE
jgi:HPt (histidine-containing phosphotransfer) domain-containing protein